MELIQDLSGRVQGILAGLNRSPFPSNDNWFMVFRESHLLFASWPVPLEQLQRLIPPVFDIETFDIETFGKSAWVTVEALQASLVRLRGVPAPRKSLDGFQMNVRSYVRFRGERGIYFLSLDVPGLVASTLARVLFKLPFHTANVTVRVNGDNYHAESLRLQRGAAAVIQFAVSGKIVGTPSLAEAGSLDDRLLNQTRLFAVAPNGDVNRGEMGHRPRVLQRVEGVVDINTLIPALGLPTPTSPPILRYCPGDDALAWPIVRVEPEPVS